MDVNQKDNYNVLGKMNIGRALGIGAGIAVGAYLTKEYIRRQKRFLGNYSPLIDQVDILTDGVKNERWLFYWDDEERCEVATRQKLDVNGNIITRTHLVFEFLEDQVRIGRYVDEAELPEEMTFIYLNEYDVITSVVRVREGEPEEVWRADINGAELSRLYTDSTADQMLWKDGNLEQITYGKEQIKQRMTYYRDAENYLFPDINFFATGFGEDMVCTYMLGIRSRHFLRNMIRTGADFHQQLHLSYLLDSFDRPVQILIEQTELRDGITTDTNKEFDIRYKRI
ncbi:MAG: hypothetical protein Q4E10_01045 [Porphyromonas sp.]|nr:hypothetical protein [Porphyromonas sp.]